MKNSKKFMGLDKSAFLKKTKPFLSDVFEELASKECAELSSFESGKTALLIVDMVNGFVKDGALASGNTLAINAPVAELAKKCTDMGIAVCALCDAHAEDSPEFDSYPPHCLAGSVESDITDEIKAVCDAVRIDKGSVNGILEKEFTDWLEKNEFDSFIVVGDCTDLCVLQLSNSLKAWFNTKNKKCRVVVPVSLVSTYDLGSHNAELTSLMALYNMSLNGVEVCSEIK